MEIAPEKLRALLQEKNLTQRKASKIAGIGERSMRRYCSEKERGNAPAHVVTKIEQYNMQKRAKDAIG